MRSVPERDDLLLEGPPNARATIALAHGAGAPMDSPFMSRMSAGLAGEGLRVVRFEFPYMRDRREKGRRRPPDPPAVLRESWLEVIARLGGGAGLVIGGKSMGGRIASMIADDAGVAGLVCLGYPFHPPGNPERLRVAHLASLRTPALIVQGSRDALGSREEVAGYTLAPSIRVLFLEDGDHSFKPRARAGVMLEENLSLAIRAVVDFVRGLRPADERVSSTPPAPE
jgi:predicted alpha/beta-hydrolase family hydrolase